MYIYRNIKRVLLLTLVSFALIPLRVYALPVPGSGILTGVIPSAVGSITINTATEQVIAYDINNQPLQVFACSTGAHGNTYTGTYTTSNYYDWHLMNGGVYSRYAIRFNNHELMHSVPYYRHSPDSLEYKQFNRLGSPASAGCCRLALADAKWLYDNTVPGTIVNVVRDPELIYPLTRPIIKIDESNVLTRGWDPTDTDPMSPYNINQPGGTQGAGQFM